MGKQNKMINIAYLSHLTIIFAYVLFFYFSPFATRPTNEAEGFSRIFVLIALSIPLIAVTILASIISLCIAVINLKEWPLIVLSLLFCLVVVAVIYDKKVEVRILLSSYIFLSILFSSWWSLIK